MEGATNSTPQLPLRVGEDGEDGEDGRTARPVAIQRPGTGPDTPRDENTF